VYTGDLGSMDSDGFLYFKGRIKRMIVSSGYNIYPSQLESVFNKCPIIESACVIGVPDDYRMQVVKLFCVLKQGIEKTEDTKKEILEYAKKYIAKYALPSFIEFRNELPKTLVGKVSYRELENEELEKQN